MTLYGNNISSSSVITVNNYAIYSTKKNIDGNYVGNWWDDFGSCSGGEYTVLENGYTYTVCGNDDYNGGYDTAPLTGVSYTPPIAPQIIVDYALDGNPTSTEKTWVLINASADSAIASCDFYFNGSSTSADTVSNQNCWLNKTGLVQNSSYQYYVEVTGTNGAINTTSTVTLDTSVGGSNPTGDDTPSSTSASGLLPYQSIFSGFMNLGLLFSFIFYFNRRRK
jgi:hypothetical protein